MIENSLQWSIIEDNLIRKSANLLYGKEVRKLIYNIRSEVTELSKAEVEARRGKKHRAKEMLLKINRDIIIVEEYLLMAALLG